MGIHTCMNEFPFVHKIHELKNVTNMLIVYENFC